MTRTEYRKARALVRGNGLHALRWMSPDHAAAMFAISRPAGDNLALRADLARIEAKHGTANPGAMAYRLTRNVTPNDKPVTHSDKNVSIHTKNA